MISSKDQAKLIFFFILSVSVFMMLNSSIKQLPPLLKVLNPHSGVWQNGRKDLKTPKLEEYLKKRVVVQFDEESIPHIFAESAADLYFVQGYLHAKHRLFQMDLLSRVGGAQLSELVGERAKRIDEYHLRIGIRVASRRALKAMLEDEQTASVIQNYVRGVNAYIDSLNYVNLPAEYKILNTWPKRFEPIHTANFLKTMSLNLAGKTYDLELTRLLKKFGSDKIKDLIPLKPYVFSPIIPNNELKPNTRGEPTSEDELNFVSVFADYPKLLATAAYAGSGDGFRGSNSWAVDKRKTKNGHNLLSNDTHLGLSLPSIWYEIQLSLGDNHVYGGSFPNAPGVIIGTNNNIAWAVTNATSDVFDWYEVDLSELNVVKVIAEAIKVRNGKKLEIQQKWTEYGPVVWESEASNKALVAQWASHQASNDFKTFYQLNFAESFSDCQKSLKDYKSPAQNFICMDRDNISMLHNTFVPVREVYQGAVVQDVSRKWSDYLPKSELPALENPKLGFVGSANQHPAGSEYKHYLGWYYDDSFRGKRINQFLSSRDNLSVQDMIDLQYDRKDLFAEKALPALLENLSIESLNDDQKKLVNDLNSWNFTIEAESYRASFFYVWWRNFRNYVWQDQLWDGELKYLPQRSRSLALLMNLSQKKPTTNDLFWFEYKGELKSLGEVVTLCFVKAYKELSHKYGHPVSSWAWYKVNNNRINHIARFPGFGIDELKTGGSLNTLKANKGSFGAAWKMVVEMSDPVNIYTQIPGGVDGNPMSVKYDEFVSDWAAGKMRQANFWMQPQSHSKVQTWEFNP